MTNEEKIIKFRQLLSNINVTNSYEVLEETGDLKTNYRDYMTTGPINCIGKTVSTQFANQFK